MPATDRLWPTIAVFMRTPLIWVGSGIVIAVYRLWGYPVGLAAGSIWATATLILVNLVCLGFLVWRAKREPFSFREALGFKKEKAFSDLGWGFVWSFVLFAAMAAGVLIVAAGMIGFGFIHSFEEAFVGNVDFNFPVPSWLVWIGIILFPLLNPFTEEMIYRGYAQPRWIAMLRSPWQGILVAAVGFALQHTAFAFTVPAMAIYAVGFLIWGLGAGIIYRKQNRLLPLLVAHFVSNLSWAIVPVFFLFQT